MNQCRRSQIALTVLCFLAMVVPPVLSQKPEPTTVERLTNKDILQMVKAQLSTEIIIEKIKRSRCNFDTEPTQLAELRSKGVAEDILQAMVDAPFGLPSSAKEQTPTAAHRQSSDENREIQDANSITVTVPEGNFVFTNLRMKPDGYDITGEIVNKTNKHWNDLTFQIVALDLAGNEIKNRYGSLVDDLRVYGLRKNETKVISHMVIGLLGLQQKPARFKMAFKSGEYNAPVLFRYGEAEAIGSTVLR